MNLSLATKSTKKSCHLPLLYSYEVAGKIASNLLGGDSFTEMYAAIDKSMTSVSLSISRTTAFPLNKFDRETFLTNNKYSLKVQLHLLI